MRDGDDLVAVDVEAGAQPVPGGLGHHDHLVGERHDLFEHRTLVRRRIFEDSVGDHDRRDAQAAHDLDDLVAVGAAVDAVLVLDDRDVALVQQLRACRDGRRRAVDEFADDLRCCAETVPVGDPHHVTSAPLLPDPSASAALNVASPHGVGGYVLRMPIARQYEKLCIPKGAIKWLTDVGAFKIIPTGLLPPA